MRSPLSRPPFPRLAAALVAGLAALATAKSPAAAQSGPAPEATFDFEDHAIEGGTVLPEGMRVLVPPNAGRTSLIQPRAQFVPELLESVERL